MENRRPRNYTWEGAVRKDKKFALANRKARATVTPKATTTSMMLKERHVRNDVQDGERMKNEHNEKLKLNVSQA